MTLRNTNERAVLSFAFILTIFFNFAPSSAHGQTTMKLLKRYETEKRLGMIDEALVGITVESHDGAFWLWLPGDHVIQSERVVNRELYLSAMSEKILSAIKLSSSTLARFSR